MPLNRGVLLYGPPGTGKSFIGKILISQVIHAKNYPADVTYIQVQARHVYDIHVVKSIFDLARKLSPSIIFIEDIDLIAGTDRNHRAEVKNELMQQLSGIEKLPGVLTIGTTNLYDEIDSALKRSKRLGFHHEIGIPKISELKRFYKLFVDKHGKLTDDELSELADLSDNMTGTDLKEVVQLSFEAALAKNPQQKITVGFDDLKAAIKEKKKFRYQSEGGQ